MPALTAEVQRTLRAGEELLHELPPRDPDRATLATLVDNLRALYADISSSSDRGADRVRATLAACDDAWQVIEAIRDQLIRPREDGFAPSG